MAFSPVMSQIPNYPLFSIIDFNAVSLKHFAQIFIILQLLKCSVISKDGEELKSSLRLLILEMFRWQCCRAGCRVQDCCSLYYQRN